MARRATGNTIIDLQIIGDYRGVEAMLDHLDSCFSAQGMLQFLGMDVTQYLRLRAKARFDNEGDDAVGRWAPLLQSTRNIRESGIARGEWPGIAPAHPINRRTGDMEQFITEGRGDVVTVNMGSALYYPQRRTPSKKGVKQKVMRAQKGDTASTVARPALGVSMTDVNDIVQSLAFFIKRGPTGV